MTEDEARRLAMALSEVVSVGLKPAPQIHGDGWMLNILARPSEYDADELARLGVKAALLCGIDMPNGVQVAHGPRIVADYRIPQ